MVTAAFAADRGVTRSANPAREEQNPRGSLSTHAPVSKLHYTVFAYTCFDHRFCVFRSKLWRCSSHKQNWGRRKNDPSFECNCITTFLQWAIFAAYFMFAMGSSSVEWLQFKASVDLASVDLDTVIGGGAKSSQWPLPMEDQ